MAEDPKKTVFDLISEIKAEQTTSKQDVNDKLMTLGNQLSETLTLVKGQQDQIKKLQDETNDAITEHSIGKQQETLYQSKRKGGFMVPSDAEFYKAMVDQNGLSKEQMLTMEERHLNKYVPDASQRDRIRRFQELNDDVLLVTTMMGHKFKKSLGHNPVQSIMRDTTTGRALGYAVKALSTSGVTTGNEWIPTVFSSQFLDLVTVSLKVAALFPRINMPHSPYAIPISTTDDVAFLVGENASDNVYTEANTYPRFTPGTDAFTMTAIKFADITVFSEEVTEESIVPILPFLRDKIVRSQANAEERATIDGDTAAVHMDNDVQVADPQSIDARRAWRGLRRLAQLVNGGANEVDLSTFNISTVRGLRAKLSDAFAEDPTNLAYIINVPTLLRMISFPEVMTVDKYGDRRATIITGELGNIDGIAITTSKYQRKTLASTGVNTNAGPNTKSVMSLVNRRGFWYGDRREMAVNTVNFVISGQGLLVATRRMTFKDIYPVATAGNATVATGINITNP
jgi:HK97 family phage major capsid protein